MLKHRYRYPHMTKRTKRWKANIPITSMSTNRSEWNNDQALQTRINLIFKSVDEGEHNILPPIEDDDELEDEV